MNTEDVRWLRECGIAPHGEASSSEDAELIAELRRQLDVVTESRDHWRAQATAELQTIEDRMDREFLHIRRDYLDALRKRTVAAERLCLCLTVLAGIAMIGLAVEVSGR